MVVARRVMVGVVLLSACAGWEQPSSSSNAPPPNEAVAPSHHAPPPGDADAPLPEVREPLRVTISSVRLSEDCPQADTDRKSEARGDSNRLACAQSTVQLVVDSTVAGSFKIEAARVFDSVGGGAVGTTRLRSPTTWTTGSNVYTPWDEQVRAGERLQVSYLLGEPSWTASASWYVLELDVSLDGRRLTLRSPQFAREVLDVVET